ncbi:CGNR zinc finger domain-containing protein [Nonomuraea jiangxiensis]|uniref:CGNR zinc finger domain-containing protein n=1 Tax=Nonomuraea jiangxiensis TaxID=633440 RepID=UPI001FE5C880|nr:CGNR zinc finger domain-containing protein [Nonomuraea jiangxiensis]
MTIDAWHITGQSQIDSYVGRWAELAVLLVNELAVTQALGRPRTPPADRLAALSQAFDQHGWIPTRALTAADADRLADVAAALRPAFTGAPDATAVLNETLVRHGAVPNLHGDPPILAFHRPGSDLVDAWAADAATALAMVIGVGQGQRLRACEAGGCDLVFLDVTRNASRRFCGLSCQNRAKASAYRARRRT